MRAVVIDDEIYSITDMEKKLELIDYITLEKSFTDSVAGLNYLIANPCDIVFLDIEMPVINGIYLAEQLLKVHPDIRICFVTAYNDYAVKAFEINAIDYILKPYTLKRLKASLERMKGDQKRKIELSNISNTLDYQLDIICGFDNEDIFLIQFENIYYFEFVDRKVYIQTAEKKFRGNKNLQFYEDKLKSKSFFRSHKSYIVNLEKIERILPRINYTYDIYFKDIDDIIPLSRKKVRELKAILEI